MTRGDVSRQKSCQHKQCRKIFHHQATHQLPENLLLPFKFQPQGKGLNKGDHTDRKPTHTINYANPGELREPWQVRNPMSINDPEMCEGHLLLISAF